MAWVERRKGCFRVAFRFAGTLFRHSLGGADEAEAGRCRARIEETLRLMELGIITIPPHVDVVPFLVSGGKLANRPTANEFITIADAFQRYQDTHATARESNTALTIRIHCDHLKKTFGARFRLRALSLADLQAHVDRRAKDVGRHGKPLSPATIKKEVATLSAIWNWCLRMNLVESPFPNEGLVYAKSKEKPPFQTWAEIQRQVDRGGLKPLEIRELWDSLFLTLPEIEELLEFVKANAPLPWVYPMFAFAAHTGARRSEILRAKITEFDFESRTVLIQERKRDKSRHTTRRVPLSSHLAEVFQEWFEVHPGGRAAIVQPVDVLRSKKTRTEPAPVTVDESNSMFKTLLRPSKWKVVRGWHVLRHSFASNCAASGVDQRLIDAWMGHQTEEMRKRYAHLLPNQQAEAIRSVFG